MVIQRGASALGENVYEDSLMKKSYLKDSRAGKINIVTIFLLLIIAAMVYLAIFLVPPYIEHYKFEEKLRAVAKYAHRQKNDSELMKEVQRECEQLGMKLPYDAIKIERDPAHGKWIHITARYIKVVDFVPFGKTIDLEFTSDIQESLE